MSPPRNPELRRSPATTMTTRYEEFRPHLRRGTRKSRRPVPVPFPSRRRRVEQSSGRLFCHPDNTGSSVFGGRGCRSSIPVGPTTTRNPDLECCPGTHAHGRAHGRAHAHTHGRALGRAHHLRHRHGDILAAPEVSRGTRRWPRCFSRTGGEDLSPPRNPDEDGVIGSSPGGGDVSTATAGSQQSG